MQLWRLTPPVCANTFFGRHMTQMTQRFRNAFVLLAAFVTVCGASLHAAPPARQQINITGYVIHADLDPVTGRLNAVAAVTFTALDDLSSVSFGLNNGLQVSKIVDGSNAVLNSERNVSDSTVRVSPSALLAKGASVTWSFTYMGAPTVGTSPVDGIKFVQVADPVSILLYPGRWFPMTGLFTDRFTAEMHITVPTGERVIGSGFSGEHAAGAGRTEFVFNWTKPGFPRHHRCRQISACG